MGYLPPVPTVPLALPAPPLPPPPSPALPAPPPQPALTNALPQMFLTYMQQQEERNRDRENTLIQMFRNRNNENMGFNSDGRINELPDELEEDLQNAGVTPAQIERVRQTQQEKNKIKSDRRLGTIHGSKGQGVRPGYEDNEYYMASYTDARTEWEKASKPTTRSDTAGAAAGAAGARPITPSRPIPPGRSPGRGNRFANAGVDELRAAEAGVAATLDQAFRDIARGY
jgi:hypothetical protein